MSTITIGFTDTPGFPAGSAVDHVRLTVTGALGSSASQAVAVGVTSVNYTFGVPDTYTVTVQAVAADGSVFGTPVSTTFVVAAPATVTLSLPSSVSVA
jgi:hypothetical protein